MALGSRYQKQTIAIALVPLGLSAEGSAFWWRIIHRAPAVYERRSKCKVKHKAA
jgi:hypothetical protein